MYFRQFWTDPRLSFERREGLEKLVVGAEYINLIWVPDTFFVNEKTAYFHKATTENQFLRILHTGEILRSIRYFFTNNSHRSKLGLKMHWKNWFLQRFSHYFWFESLIGSPLILRKGCINTFKWDHSQYCEWPYLKRFTQPLHSVNELYIKCCTVDHNIEK